jgi:hypothetical protein
MISYCTRSALSVTSSLLQSGNGPSALLLCHHYVEALLQPEAMIMCSKRWWRDDVQELGCVSMMVSEFRPSCLSIMLSPSYLPSWPLLHLLHLPLHHGLQASHTSSAPQLPHSPWPLQSGRRSRLPSSTTTTSRCPFTVPRPQAAAIIMLPACEGRRLSLQLEVACTG